MDRKVKEFCFPDTVEEEKNFTAKVYRHSLEELQKIGFSHQTKQLFRIVHIIVKTTLDVLPYRHKNPQPE
jgi:hypothetical protein